MSGKLWKVAAVAYFKFLTSSNEKLKYMLQMKVRARPKFKDGKKNQGVRSQENGLTTGRQRQPTEDQSAQTARMTDTDLQVDCCCNCTRLEEWF
jgi:hypothetical protein